MFTLREYLKFNPLSRYNDELIAIKIAPKPLKYDTLPISEKNSHLQTNRFGVLGLLSNIVNTMLHHKKKLGRKKNDVV